MPGTRVRAPARGPSTSLVPGIHAFSNSSKKVVDGRVKRAFTPVFDGLRPAMTMSNENPDFIDRISGQTLRMRHRAMWC
jgi:hypothetical protein